MIKIVLTSLILIYNSFGSIKPEEIELQQNIKSIITPTHKEVATQTKTHYISQKDPYIMYYQGVGMGMALSMLAVGTWWYKGPFIIPLGLE